MLSICVLATLVVCATAASLKEQSTVTENEKTRYDGYNVYKLHIKDIYAVTDLIKDLKEKVIQLQLLSNSIYSIRNFRMYY